MQEVAKESHPSEIIHCACYNIGCSYYEGVGVKQSDVEAEFWWLQAAQDGFIGGCVKAMSVLGMYYSRLGEEQFDLKKVCVLV